MYFFFLLFIIKNKITDVSSYSLLDRICLMDTLGEQPLTELVTQSQTVAAEHPEGLTA